jgi:hypothetical protein
MEALSLRVPLVLLEYVVTRNVARVPASGLSAVSTAGSRCRGEAMWFRMLRLTPFAGVISATLMLLLFIPSTARAECGGYVVLGHEMGSTRQTNVPNEFLAKSSGHDQSSSRRHAPCSGPLCGRAPVEVPSTPMPRAPAGAQEWGHLTSQPFSDLPELGTFISSSDGQRPVRQTAAIYHPPRISCISS